MILFHVETLDFDQPDLRSRAWLPVLSLRRTGLAARVVVGDVSSEVIGAGKCIILTGGASGHALSVARKAAAARVPIILDIGSVDILKGSLAGPHRQQLVEIAALAVVVTASNEALARHVEEVLGVTGVLVTPDPIDIEDGLFAALRANPGAAVRAVGKWIDAAARDEVAKLRHRRSAGAGRKRIVWFGAGRRPNDEGGVAELLLAACDLADLAEEMPIQLDVVGRSPRAARRFLKQLPVPITFYRYAPWRVRQRLRQADLCLLPAGGDVEGRARSLRRAGLASALGVPVVAAAPATPLLPALRAALKAEIASERPGAGCTIGDGRLAAGDRSGSSGGGPAASGRHRPSRGEQAARPAAAPAVPGHRPHCSGRGEGQRLSGYRGSHRRPVQDRNSGIAALTAALRQRRAGGVLARSGSARPSHCAGAVCGRRGDHSVRGARFRRALRAGLRRRQPRRRRARADLAARLGQWRHDLRPKASRRRLHVGPGADLGRSAPLDRCGRAGGQSEG